MTAVNWMIEELIKKHVGKVGNEYVEIFEQAKQLEKQEIMDAYKVGNIEGYYTAREYNDLIKYEDSEQYYNETYGSKGSDVTSSQTEISDEEIEKAARNYDNGDIYGPPLVNFEQGAFWYREQLKSGASQEK